MPAVLSRADLVAAAPVWLLEVTWAGRVFRFSSRPVDLASDDGAVTFEGGLEDPEFSLSLQRLSTSPQGQSVSVEVHFPVDVAKERRHGFDLGAATAELSMVLDKWGTIQQTWEDRFRLMAGRVINPQWGDPTRGSGWAAFTVEEQAYDDASRLMGNAPTVSFDTWTAPHLDHLGKAYPQIIGSPGAYIDPSDGSAETVRGSPAYIVEYTTIFAGNEADKLVIAGHPVHATAVTVIDGDDAEETFPIAHEQDDQGRLVTTVTVTGASTIDLTDAEFWIAWHSGGGLASPFQPSASLRGAGDVCRWALSYSSVPVDHGRWAAAAAFLNRFKIDTYINDIDATPWEWLSDHVLPLLPITIQRGPDGLYPVVMDLAAGVNDATAVTAGPDFLRVGPVTAEKPRADVVNHYTFDYAKDGSTGDHFRRARLESDHDTTDPQAISNWYVKVSKDRYGELRATDDSDVVFDDATAVSVMEWRSRVEGFIPSTVPYDADTSWGWVTLGQIIAITDDDLFWTDQLATVIEKAWNGVGWSFTLLIDDDLARDSHST